MKQVLFCLPAAIEKCKEMRNPSYQHDLEYLAAELPKAITGGRKYIDDILMEFDFWKVRKEFYEHGVVWNFSSDGEENHSRLPTIKDLKIEVTQLLLRVQNWEYYGAASCRKGTFLLEKFGKNLTLKYFNEVLARAEVPDGEHGWIPPRMICAFNDEEI